MFHKNKLIKFLTVVFAAVFFIGVGASSANAAVGDRGTDQSEYQGAYGKYGYGDEKFQINQIGGYYDGRFVPHWTYSTQTQSDLSRGIHAHTYIYSQFSTRWEADQMLNYYLPRVQTPRGSIVALDVESGNPNPDAVLYALNRIHNSGYTAVLYGYKNFLINHLGYNGLYNISTQYPLWLAEYPDYSVRRYPNYGFFPSFNNVAIFQFTSTYTLGGLDGDVDLTGITNNGYGQHSQAQPKQQPAQHPATTQKAQPQPAANTYTVRYGDSWWAIANKYNMNMYDLSRINGKSINSVIYPGQVLRIRANAQTNQQSNTSGNSWRDSLGDTWHSERGTFTSNTWLNLRWGARTNSSRIALLAPGQTVKYDAWSSHNGYVWIRQPRANNTYGYVTVRNANNHVAFGSFK